MPRISRGASHAGSWYEDDERVLDEELSGWLSSATHESGSHATAIIAPHAGYRYSGHVAAFAYKQIDPDRVRRVFLVGPSHHYYTKRCCLTMTDTYDTPLGPIKIDTKILEQLKATGKFEIMDVDVDEAEHSLELHLPYIKKIMGGRDFTLVPIMVGSLSYDAEEQYGALLAPYLEDEQNVFVISSDFCHWGSRFQFTYYDKAQGPIWKSIEALDKQGMDLIESQEPRQFADYLKRYQNTICGRHPILVLMHAMQALKGRLGFRVEWRKYDQSSRCETQRDSSVSYAAAVVVREG